MKDQIYILNNENKLIELNENDFVNEEQFQLLLEDYPNLISGSQINPDNPRRWILISREIGIPGEQGGNNIWSLDHLFIDQDGIPTLVEVKRSSDTRIRREVVGQMLDYAANSVSYWTIDEIKLKFEQHCEKSDKDPDLELENLLGENSDFDKFWDTIDTNLKAGKIRLLFVADKTPKELQRIIEFLNEQMSPAEVLGLEIKQYSNNDLKTLVPRVIGKTSSAQNKKDKREYNQWTEETFLAELQSKKSIKHVDIVKRIMKHFENKISRFWYGKGKSMGSIVPVFDKEYSNQLFGIWTSGYIEIYFQYYLQKLPFDKIEKRQELLKKLNKISGISLPENKIDKRPSFDLDVLLDEIKLNEFLKIYDWFLDEINKTQK
ncbi:MAG: hypothetical protein GX587_07845 [Bacteroidales bacterium]|nr:hypothetical protein [Bacteroidales bacterium]